MPLAYRVQLIPTSRKQRPGYRMVGGRPSSLSEHNVGAKDSTAANNADYFCNNDLPASAHIFVDDMEAVLIIPLNEQAWHTGTNAGNTTSVGIETCEFTDPARAAAAERNTQILIADMLTGRAPVGFQTPHLKLSDVRTHQSWSGKYCPRMILPHWDAFIAGIGALMASPPAPAPAPKAEDAAVLFHAESDDAMQLIVDAWGKGFAGYPHPAGKAYRGGLSHTDSLNYIPKGASAETMFPNPDGLHSVGAIHCSADHAAKVKAYCDANQIACTVHPAGPHHVGYPSMTAALAAALTKGIDFPAVFGVPE